MTENVFWTIILLVVIALGVIRGWFRIQGTNRGPGSKNYREQQRKFEEQYYRTHPREEFDGYLKSLTVNGWEPTGPENSGPPTITYYRRASDHPLRRR